MQVFYDLGGEDPVTGMVAPSARVKVTEEPVAKPALCSGRFLLKSAEEVIKEKV